MDFMHDGRRYNIVPNSTGTRLVLWYNSFQGHGWEFGHAKEVPAGVMLHHAAKHMQDFATGKIQHHEYSELLPTT